MTQYAGPVPSQPDHTWALPSAAPSATVHRPSSGLAIASLILSFLALVGVLAVAGWMFVSGTPLPGETKSPLSGELQAVPTNRTLEGARLAAAVSATVENNLGEVSNLTCADTARLTQGVVTVCHGFSGGDPWVLSWFSRIGTASSPCSRHTVLRSAGVCRELVSFPRNCRILARRCHGDAKSRLFDHRTGGSPN